MSSSTKARPGFRLVFGYPHIVLTAEDESGSLAEALVGAPDFPERMREIAGIIGRGRLVAVLPEETVWRGYLRLDGRTALGRRVEARRAVADLLGLKPRQVVAVTGAETGTVPVAATRTEVLTEAHRFLRKAGLRPVAVIGAGDFPGFAGPPKLAGAGWPRVGTLAAGLALSATTVALCLSLWPEPPETAITGTPGPVVAMAPAPALVVTEPRAVPAPPARPEPVKPAALAAPREARPLNATPAPARPSMPGPVVTVATRNMPDLGDMRAAGQSGTVRLAERKTTSAILSDVVTAPPPRPFAGLSQADGNEPRPLARPGRAGSEPLRTTARADTPRPMPRPGQTIATPVIEPVRVAALTATATDATTLRAQTDLSVDRPEPRPVFRTAAPAAKAVPVVKPTPVAKVTPAAKPAPLVKTVATQPTRAQQVNAARPSPVTPATVKPATVTLAAARPVAVRPAAVTTARQEQPRAEQRRIVEPPAKVAARAPVEKTGLTGRGPSLLGVFGPKSARYALLRMPNGKIKRVKPGDSIDGTRVALVGDNSVRLAGGNRDVLLLMAE